MIKQITLRAGPTPSQGPLSLPLSPVTIFVGPNNSGKTRALAEIQQFCQSGVANTGWLVVKDVVVQAMAEADAKAVMQSMETEPLQGEVQHENHRFYRYQGDRHQIQPTQFLGALTNPPSHMQAFCGWFLRYRTLMLDGPSRIQLVNQQSAGDLQQDGTSSLQVLFRKDDLRKKLRGQLFEAFNLYFTIDPTNVGTLRIKFAETPPPSNGVERGWSAESVAYHGKSKDIQHFSDGVKAFTGILMGVTGGDPRVLLIDEPEAFLHPALAFKLGQDIAETTVGSTKRLFVSTHSPDFLMGCIQSGAPVNIVRLTYRKGSATSRVLPSDRLLRLMRNPLLRSTGTLAGVFYEFVVVTEADADRAFYQEINERLTRLKPVEGVPNTLFLNAQNRQTVDQIIKPLRELGIPAAAIIDVDVIKEGGTVFSRLLEAAFVPEIHRQSLATARAKLKQAFDAIPHKDMTHDGGITLLGRNESEAAEAFCKGLVAHDGVRTDGGRSERRWLCKARH